ncbi:MULTISPECIES: MerC domain-containing protein [unclassified Pseudoalteromonas]|uniref:MerC domain-containing protein n=1 Tax=unclassified Pseudoalteromonas TaxID=194690 RepID=UPI002096F1CF|nr:MerC domain-containing protein [Pseudoalteromonas sp. XMcav2-N]MCO7188089.1 MerC domain-containing protein [Pseudoalteromonas sp. XMcav2-N]
MKNLSEKLDRYAISLSAMCVIHCLFVPLLVALLPAFGATFFSDEAFHRWLLIGVLATSSSALFLGCKKHNQWRILGYGTAGIGVLFFAAFFAHDLMAEEGEKLLTILGSVLLVISHYKNFNLCQTGRCH